MEPNLSKGAVDMLEEVRAVGGDELVKQVKKAKALEAEFITKIGHAHIEFMEACEASGLPEVLACASACNGFSHAYALGIALLGHVTPNSDRASLIATAIQNLMANLDRTFDEVTAHQNKVGDKIVAAAKGFKEEEK